MQVTRSLFGLVVLAGCPDDGVAVTEAVPGTSSGAGGGATDSAEATGAPDGSGGEVPTTGSGANTTGAGTGTSGGSPGSSGEPGLTGSSGATGTVGSSGEGSSGGGVCGDGAVDPGEGCDDGNVLADDGCSPGCEVGPGAAGEPVELPVAPFEDFVGLAVVDKQALGGASHGLAVVGSIAGAGPESQVAAHVQLRAAQGGAKLWAYLEYAGVFGRQAFKAATAANGDVLVAGWIYTEQVKPDSGGHTWIGRFSPQGVLLWSVEPMGAWTRPIEAVMTSDGDLAVVGYAGGLGGVSLDAYRFRGSDGALLWSYSEPWSMVHGGYYAGMALDAEDNLYIVGRRFAKADPKQQAWLFVRALDADGGDRWEFERVSAKQESLIGRSITVTTDEQLFVVGVETPGDTMPTTLLLMGLDLEGTPLWSQTWEPPAPDEVWLGEGVAAPDGGVYLVGSHGPKDARKGITARFDAAGAPVWSNPGGASPGLDLALDPDGLLQVLTKGAVVPYLP